MELNPILEVIEEQKRQELLSIQLYRYSGLVRAIEYFSQKLNLEQIVDAAFDFVCELLALEKAAVFAVTDDSCLLKKMKGFNSSIKKNVKGKNLQNLVLNGTVLYDRTGLERYFDASVLEKYGITAVIPLIVEQSLYGFIMIANKAAESLSHDDRIISEALMRLINNALENYRRYEQLQKSNRELDEKIFNLFAINQSSKVLLSELDPGVLHKLSVDVFSELTQSMTTGFVLYDEKAGRYELKAFRDVFSREAKVSVCLSQEKGAVIDANRVIIDVSDPSDVIYFNSLFKEGIEAINPLAPLYLVFLEKNGRILGFVTLGRTTTGSPYKTSVFELIESLASATYIAISNAALFKQANDQNLMIQEKFRKQISLTNLIKNINTALKVDSLLELTMKTLKVSFDVKKAFIALYNKDSGTFNITDLLNLELENRAIKPGPRWKAIFEGKVIFDAREKCAQRYFDASFIRDAGKINGVFLVPVFIDRVGIELLGVIAIFKYGGILLDDMDIRLTVETIASHIAPVMGNLLTIEEQKRFSLPNYIEIFKSDLNRMIKQALEFSTRLEVIRLQYDANFSSEAGIMAEMLKTFYKCVYPFTNNDIFVINEGSTNIAEGSEDIFEGLENVSIRRYTLGEDFSDYKDFFKLF